MTAIPTLETREWREQRDTWTCPGCLRRKAECEVPKGDGQTLRWLVRHHDHMADYVGAYIKKRFGKHHAFCADHPNRREALAHVDNIKALASRFGDTVVCQDCNIAEGKIKARVSADKYFSFHIHEIRRAFVPRPYQAHAFVEEHMPYYARLYAANADRLVHQRKRVIETLVDQAQAQGQYWGNAMEPAVTFSAHELTVVYPTFDTGSRIAQGLKNGQPVLQGAPWTAEQDERLRASAARGHTIEAIAAQSGRTPSGVRFRLAHLGIEC